VSGVSVSVSGVSLRWKYDKVTPMPYAPCSMLHALRSCMLLLLLVSFTSMLFLKIRAVVGTDPEVLFVDCSGNLIHSILKLIEILM